MCCFASSFQEKTHIYIGYIAGPELAGENTCRQQAKLEHRRENCENEALMGVNP